MADTDSTADRVEISIQLTPRTVHVHPALTALGARALNQDAVTRALGDAGIDYFAVRGMDDRPPVIGVRADDRRAALTVLAALARRTAGYMAAVLPKPGGRDLLAEGS